MLSRVLRYFEKTALLYAIGLAIGIGLSMTINVPETNGSEYVNLTDFRNIALKNSLIILTIYISVIFTKIYGYGVCCINGIILGLTCGWIMQTNVRLLLLIAPHGVFEIPNLLATGYILTKDEKSIRHNLKKYATILGAHIVFTLFCAVIEVYVTPYFYAYI